MTWCMYALGGGWGHLVRALAFARIASRHHPIVILTNCPHLPLIQSSSSWQKEVKEFGLQLRFIPIPSEATIDSVCHEMPKIIRDIAPEVLFVDTFPRGIVGDLVPILPKMQQCQRIFVHRDISPNYLLAYHIEEFVLKHYSQTVSVERFTPLSHIGTTSEPWVMRSSRELGPGNQEAGIVICVSGKVEEQELFEMVSLKLCHLTKKITILSARHPKIVNKNIIWSRHFPGIEVINKAELVVGSGGYHTVYECQVTRKKLISITFSRLYDQQKRRCQKNNIAYFESDKMIGSDKNPIAQVLNLLLREIDAHQVQIKHPFNEKNEK
ncbi:MAG: hypothetical protein HC919_08590 [Oscillatoriales cyanobacterium SM2_2_1]|nr:hypothetical protein [Oscillatoriales cyanobacterium SM2_2_1]